jgi:hypothetical protein
MESHFAVPKCNFSVTLALFPPFLTPQPAPPRQRQSTKAKGHRQRVSPRKLVFRQSRQRVSKVGKGSEKVGKGSVLGSWYLRLIWACIGKGSVLIRQRVSPRKLVFEVDLGGGRGHRGPRFGQTVAHRSCRSDLPRPGPGQSRPSASIPISQGQTGAFRRAGGDKMNKHQLPRTDPFTDPFTAH